MTPAESPLAPRLDEPGHLSRLFLTRPVIRNQQDLPPVEGLSFHGSLGSAPVFLGSELRSGKDSANPLESGNYFAEACF